ncbi:MAG TPA: prepilin-type N-terminal cleavage/methylation domain-containing protein [Methylomirabilota bacterium]|nr:prepilin-type N-terminal cleavage/methylation domain-containing protein [Methylomirabilota bacterium]
MGAWRQERGFSLTELLVVTAVLGCVLAGLWTLLQAGFTAYGLGTARIEAQQSARVALERMVKELREAGYDPTAAGIPAVTIAEPERVAFQRDLNGNGTIDPTHERVTFLVRPGETVLRRDAGGGAQPIAEGVRRLALTYYDRAGTVTSDPARVAAIRIQLEVAFSGPGIVAESHVTLRNVLD